MVETQIHKIALNHLNERGQKLLSYAQEHPVKFGLISVTIVAGVATVAVPLALGFSATGPVAGSIAAAWQSSIGNVVAGSFFSLLQSMTMSGTLDALAGRLLTAAAVSVFVEWSKSADWDELISGWMSFAESLGVLQIPGWERGEQLVRGVDWEGAAGDVAGGVERAVQEALQNAAWVGEAVQDVDWARVGDEAVRGAGFVMKDVVQGAGWAANEAAQGIGIIARRLL